VEAVIIGLTLLTLLWLMAQWLGWLPVGPNAGLLKPAVFILYMQAGALMLKQVFVRWRMKLPLRRVDDYRRWREAWLSYHLRVFDAMRLLLAFYLWAILAFKSFRLWWGAEQMKPPGLALQEGSCDGSVAKNILTTFYPNFAQISDEMSPKV
jgi:hypothetical protein